MGLDCDLYVMSDKEPTHTRWKSFSASFLKQGLPIEKIEDTPGYLHFKCGDKAVWVFREDNRDTLARIAEQKLQIHHFVGICDGCMEGGNHECVHERPFLSHLLPLAADGMQYTTDHSRPLQQCNPYTRQRKFVERQYWGGFPPPKGWQSAPESGQRIPDDVEFSLQAILYRDGQHLEVLRFGDQPHALKAMSAFRSLHHRGILAEYRLRCWPQRDLSLEAALLFNTRRENNDPV